MITNETPLDRIIKYDELYNLVNMSKGQIMRLEKEGKFPQRIKLGERRTGWSFNEVQEWIVEKKNAR